jgi:hypothetical protein
MHDQQNIKFDIANRYELDDPGIEFRVRRDIFHPFRPILLPTRPPVQWVSGHNFRGKAAMEWL